MAKKDKKTPASTAIPNTTPNTAPLDTSQMTPEQITQMQLEQAIKESADPTARLKKLKSPLSFKGCFLQILILISSTLVIGFLIINFFFVDRFELNTLVVDMLEKFGITGLVNNIVDAVKNFFGIK